MVNKSNEKKKQPLHSRFRLKYNWLNYPLCFWRRVLVVTITVKDIDFTHWMIPNEHCKEHNLDSTKVLDDGTKSITINVKPCVRVFQATKVPLSTPLWEEILIIIAKWKPLGGHECSFFCGYGSIWLQVSRKVKAV